MVPTDCRHTPLTDRRFWKDYARRETAGTDAADSHFIAEARPSRYHSRRDPLRHFGRALVLQNRCVIGHSSGRRRLSLLRQ